MDAETNAEAGARAVLAERYEMGALLGRGGMAEVYRGQDLRLGRTVAIKLLRGEMAAQEQFRCRFEAEARSAATLSHPNVVAIYDTGEDNGRPFIVMECLPGQTVENWIARGPMSEAEVIALATAALAGLQAAHEAGLVHRDVKPGNILATPQGSWKVCDFGIAKALDALDLGLTTTGLLVGTPAYLSPERIAGEAATPASDIYSLGTVLYEALTATKPFGSPSTLGLVAAIQGGTSTPLRALRPDVSPGFAAVIERAMSKEPGDRYPSAAAMAEAIALSAGGPLASDARPTDPTEVIVSPAGAFIPAWHGQHAETVALGVPQGRPGRSGASGGSPESPLARRRDVFRRSERLVVSLVVLAVLIFGTVFALTQASAPPPAPAPNTTLSTSPGTSGLPPALSQALDNLANLVRQ
jgi:serine/threonine protein kinase